MSYLASARIHRTTVHRSSIHRSSVHRSSVHRSGLSITAVMLALTGAALGGCASNAESEDTGPDTAQLPEEPTLPGGSSLAPVTLPGETEFQQLLQGVAQVETLDAAGLQQSYPTAFSDTLGYEASSAEFMDRIQASALGLNDAELGVLNDHGFVVSSRQVFPTFLRGYAAVYSEDLPVYISADAMLDAVHRAYDLMLQSIETTVLIPKLDTLLRQMLAALPTVEADAQVKADTQMYLEVAQALLSGVSNSADPRVATFVAKATAAEGMESSEFFGGPRLIDFSQFTPRGHYTDSEELSAYFRAMMWLGRIDLRLIETLADGSQVFHRNQYDTTLVLHQLLDAADNRDLWNQVDLVIRTFVGDSDYMVVPEVAELIADLGGLASALAASNDQVVGAIAAGGYGEQQIASHLMVNDGTVKTLPLNRSFLLFGQRYIVDSHVFSEVVFDRVAHRMMPTPLDAAFAALGNNQALTLNQAELAQVPDYPGALGRMRVLIDAHDQQFWDSNFYNLWTSSLRALSPNAFNDGLPAVAKTEAWGRRLLNTQLGSWAQLRHDTLLYAKQSYTGIPACEFPDAYVDPYPEFFDALRRYAERGSELLPQLSGNEQLSESIADYFDNLRTASAVLGEIAQQQLDGLPATVDQLAFINDAVRIEQQAAGCTTIEVPDGWYAKLFLYPESSIELDLTIADVHTQPADQAGNIVGRVLHVGTALPRLMVTTVDTCVGPRAYVGMAYSYHEQVTENFDRLTDERWTEQVYQAAPADVPWMQPIVAE